MFGWLLCRYKGDGCKWLRSCTGRGVGHRTWYRTVLPCGLSLEAVVTLSWACVADVST